MKSLMNILFNNFHIKLIALLLATGVWVYAVNAGMRIDHLETQVPVAVFNLDSEFALAEELPEVDLQVRAPQNVWGSLTSSDFTAFIDLEDFTPGTYTIDIRVVTEIPGVQILNKEPDPVTITIENKEAESFAVNVETTGNVAEGFVTETPAVDPESVSVSGALSVIEKVSKVVAPVVLDNEEVEITQTAELIALDESGNEINNLSFEPATVRVTIPVEKQNETKNVGIKANITGTPASGFAVESVDLSQQTVALIGKPSDLESIQSISTEAISVSGATQTLSRTVNLVLPENIETEDEATVTVTITISQSKQEKNVEAEILYSGLAENLEISSSEVTNILLGISGTTAAVSSVSDQTIQVEIDLGGLKEGTHTIEVNQSNISAPSGVDIDSIQPGSFSITLSAK